MKFRPNENEVFLNLFQFLTRLLISSYLKLISTYLVERFGAM